MVAESCLGEVPAGRFDKVHLRSPDGWLPPTSYNSSAGRCCTPVSWICAGGPSATHTRSVAAASMPLVPPRELTCRQNWQLASSRPRPRAGRGCGACADTGFGDGKDHLHISEMDFLLVRGTLGHSARFVASDCMLLRPLGPISPTTLTGQTRRRAECDRAIREGSSQCSKSFRHAPSSAIQWR